MISVSKYPAAYPRPGELETEVHTEYSNTIPSFLCVFTDYISCCQRHIIISAPLESAGHARSPSSQRRGIQITAQESTPAAQSICFVH